MWTLKKKPKKSQNQTTKKTPQKELIDTENRLVVAKGEEGVREIGQGVKATNFQL